jgi:hypothetical protein
MVKWIWKLYTQKDSLWARLLSAKYLKDGDFFKSKDKGVPALQKHPQDQALVQMGGGAIHMVGDGKLTKYWDDVWITSPPVNWLSKSV